ncbi:MAG: dTMP kinase [Candidatus Hydrogenedentota bacterium]
MKKRGIFITFEGPEGSGKTTQSSRLVQYLRDRGNEVLYTREPGGSLIGDKIRGLLLDPKNKEMISTTELLLYAACRAQHIEEMIKPALMRGTIVICDRFMDSSTAYQGYGRQLDLELIETLNKIAVNGCLPDITLVLDIEAERGLKKAIALAKDESAGTPDRIEEMGISFHRRVREGYKKIQQKEPDRVKYIYVNDDEDKIFEKVLDFVKLMLIERGFKV